MRILVIEDDERAVMYLRKGLSEAGFVVEDALHGEDGLELATTRTYDLIILDVMLPRRNGWSVMSELRQKVGTPVIFLTARDAVSSAPMITCSSPLHFPSSWRAFARYCGARPSSRYPLFRSPTWNWT